MTLFHIYVFYIYHISTTNYTTVLLILVLLLISTTGTQPCPTSKASRPVHSLFNWYHQSHFLSFVNTVIRVVCCQWSQWPLAKSVLATPHRSCVGYCLRSSNAFRRDGNVKPHLAQRASRRPQLGTSQRQARHGITYLVLYVLLPPFWRNVCCKMLGELHFPVILKFVLWLVPD